MNTVVKLSNDYENFLAQFLDPSDAGYTEELSDTNDFVFSIPESESQVGFIQEYKKISFFLLDGVIDELLWTGFVRDIEYLSGDELFRITCGDEKAFLKKKIIYSDVNWSGTPIATVLNTLVTQSNSRAGNSFLSYETNLTSTVTKEFKTGTTYFDILNEIAELLEAEWTVEKGKIIFNSTIGEDKTAGSKFFELIFNVDSPNETNIQFSTIRRGDKLTTAMLGKDGSGTSNKIDLAAIAEFGRVEHFESFSNGSLAIQTQNYLDKHKISQREIDVKLADPTIDFRSVNVGDLIHVRINKNNPLINLETDMKVIEKRVRFIDGYADLDLKVSELNRKVESFSNTISGIAKGVKDLQVQ